MAELAPALLFVSPLLAIVAVPASAGRANAQLGPERAGGAREVVEHRSAPGTAGGRGGVGVAEASFDCAPSPTLFTAATR